MAKGTGEMVARTALKTLSAVVVMLAASSVCRAAGFDCARATAPIEKVICGNAKLSACDSELATAFAAKRQSLGANAARGLVEQQRRWLANRLAGCEVPAKGEAPNPPSDITLSCLAYLYQERIRQFSPSSSATGSDAGTCANMPLGTETVEKRFPPYPDVWGGRIPLPVQDANSLTFAYRLPDGDIRFVVDWEPVPKSAEQKEPRHAFWDFFAQKFTEVTAAEKIAFLNINKPVVAGDKELLFDDGGRVFRKYTYGCDFMGYATASTYTEKAVLILSIVKMPDIDNGMNEECASVFHRNVDTYPYDYIALQDGTFLAYSLEFATVARLRKDLTSDAMSDSIFVADKSIIDQIHHSIDANDPGRTISLDQEFHDKILIYIRQHQH